MRRFHPGAEQLGLTMKLLCTSFGLAVLCASSGCFADEAPKSLATKLESLGGPGAKKCGAIALGSAREEAFSCARDAATSGQAFLVAFQYQGIDSSIWQGAAGNGGAGYWVIDYDSDATGGSNHPKPTLQVSACNSIEFVAPGKAMKCRSAVATANEPERAVPLPEKCGVTHKVDGKEAVVALESLHVNETTADNKFALPKDAPSFVSGIVCGRSSLIPTKNDVKVLQAGFPFYIVGPDGRIAVIELSDGQLQYRTVHGEFASDEMPQIQEFLDANQEAFYKPAPK